MESSYAWKEGDLKRVMELWDMIKKRLLLREGGEKYDGNREYGGQ